MSRSVKNRQQGFERDCLYELDTTMTSVIFISLNCRGLIDCKKTVILCNWVNYISCDIVFLQETHFFKQETHFILEKEYLFLFQGEREHFFFHFSTLFDL